MRKTILSVAISATLFSSVGQAEVTEAILYPNGGNLIWSEKISIDQGNHSLTVSGLPFELDDNSLQVAFDNGLNAEIRQVSVSLEEHNETESEEYWQLQTKKIALLSAIQWVDYQADTADMNIKFTSSIAQKPGDEFEASDIKEVSNNLLEIRLNAYQKKIDLAADRRELEKELDLIERKIQALIVPGKSTKKVTIEYVAKRDSKGDLNLEFHVPTVGWSSAYNARLDTETDRLVIEHKALIEQQSGVDWNNVDLSLSLMRPSKGATLPEPRAWDIHRRSPQPEMKGMSLRAKSSDMAMASFAEAAPQATLVESGRTQSFRINGPVSLKSKGENQVVVINKHELEASVKTHFMPYFNTEGYLIAHAKFNGKESLPPGRVTLYRDGQMVGPWSMRGDINPNEELEMGFGVDDRVSLKVIKEKDERGTSGLVTKENTWERLNRYDVQNHYDQSVDIRVIERLPVSRHEDIKVTHHSVSRPFINKYQDKEGVIAWDRELGANEAISLTSGFEIKTPEDQKP